MKCCNCSRDIPENSLFCNWCGKKQLREKEKKIKIPAPRQLPSGSWTVQLRREGVNITEPTEEACRAKALAVRAGFLEAEKNVKITAGAAIESYIAANTAILSPATLKGYDKVRRTAFQDVMDKDVGAVNWPAAVNREAGRVSAKTLKNGWAVISASLRAAGVPVPEVKLPRVPKPDTPWLDYEQVLVFVNAIRDTPVELPALLALHSLRRSEIFALTADHIDLSADTIRVSGSVVLDSDNEWVHKPQNKNASSQRTVPIVIPRLHDLLKTCTGEIFPPCSHRLLDQINRICKENGLPLVGVHGLRRSFASLAYHLGWPEHETMRVGGWSDYKTMHDVYIKLSEKDSTAAVRKMRRFYSVSKSVSKKASKKV